MSPQLTTTIYALVDPRTQLIHYVGRSTLPEQRYAQHLWCARGNEHPHPVYVWIRELLDLGLDPGFVILQTCTGSAYTEERHTISVYRQLGHPLLNLPNAEIGGRGRMSTLAPTPSFATSAVSDRRQDYYDRIHKLVGPVHPIVQKANARLLVQHPSLRNLHAYASQYVSSSSLGRCLGCHAHPIKDHFAFCCPFCVVAYLMPAVDALVRP